MFARLGDKSLPQITKEVTTSSNTSGLKCLVASKIMKQPAPIKSILRKRVDNKHQRKF